MISGPSSSYAAIYTALEQALRISVWSKGPNTPKIVSLDFDLYEKSYKLIISREKMKQQYILRLGKLFAKFAHMRTIGNLIAGSELEDPWI